MSASTATSPVPNSRQVGGEHYKTGGVEHWDLFGLEYLIACASKYVSRWRQKEGVQDLEKAIHYCEKAQEVMGAGASHVTNTLPTARLLEWARGTRMTAEEVAICHAIVCTCEFERAIKMIREIIARESAPDAAPAPVLKRVQGVVPTTVFPQNGPGTPEDGGHHARQTPDEGEEAELLWTLDKCDIVEKRLPPSLSNHEWQHHCSEAVQGCYKYDVSAARYLIKDDLRHYTHHCTARG